MLLQSSFYGKSTSEIKIAVIGGGNWGTAIARRIAINVLHSPIFHSEVQLWIHDEEINGENLTDIINTRHENVKYLPGVQLPCEIIASNDLESVCKDADVLMFAVPHQFLSKILQGMRGNVKKGAIGVSLIKGIRIGQEGPQLLSSMIKEDLKIANVAVVMGANVATEVIIEIKEIVHAISFLIDY